MSDELKRWHAVLHAAYGQVRGLTARNADDLRDGMREGWPPGISSASLVALGEAMGVLSKARAMLARDIDAMVKPDKEIADEPTTEPA